MSAITTHRALVFSLTLASGCVSRAEPTDTNTNWFQSCERQSDCAEGLSCICELCTAPCSAQSDCSAASSDALCTQTASCGEARVCQPAAESDSAAGSTTHTASDVDMSAPPESEASANGASADAPREALDAASAVDVSDDPNASTDLDVSASQTDQSAVDAGSPPCGACEPRICEGFFVANNQEQLDALTGCTEITEGLSITFDADLEPLSQLERSGSWINLGNASAAEPWIQSLKGLRSLRYAYGLMFENIGVSSLEGLENLEQVGSEEGEVDGGGFQLSGSPNLENLSGLQGLERTTSLHLSQMPNLESLDGIEQLERVSNDVTLRDLPKLESTRALAGAREIGVVEVERCSALESFDAGGLVVLQRVIFNNNPQLTLLPGLRGLAEISSVEITGNPALTELSLPELLSATFRFTVAENSLLELLDVPALTEVGSLELYNNPALETAQAEQVASLAEHRAPAKIGGNRGDATPPRDPCPWTEDVTCDEAEGSNLCAKDTDAFCDVVPL